MKKRILTIILFLFLGIVPLMIFYIIKKTISYEKKQSGLSTLAPFDFHDINGEAINDSNFKSTNNLLLIFFNTECEYCQHEASEIASNKNKFSDTQILFISKQKKSHLLDFSYSYKLNEIPFVKLISDTSSYFSQYYNTPTIPTTYIYRKNKFIKLLVGQTKAETILSEIR